MSGSQNYIRVQRVEVHAPLRSSLSAAEQSLQTLRCLWEWKLIQSPNSIDVTHQPAVLISWEGDTVEVQVLTKEAFVSVYQGRIDRRDRHCIEVSSPETHWRYFLFL